MSTVHRSVGGSATGTGCTALMGVGLHELRAGDVFGYWDGQRRDHGRVDGRVETVAYVEEPYSAAGAYRSSRSPAALGSASRRPRGADRCRATPSGRVDHRDELSK